MENEKKADDVVARPGVSGIIFSCVQYSAECGRQALFVVTTSYGLWTTCNGI